MTRTREQLEFEERYFQVKIDVTASFQMRAFQTPKGISNPARIIERVFATPDRVYFIASTQKSIEVEHLGFDAEFDDNLSDDCLHRSREWWSNELSQVLVDEPVTYYQYSLLVNTIDTGEPAFHQNDFVLDSAYEGTACSEDDVEDLRDSAQGNALI